LSTLDSNLRLYIILFYLVLISSPAFFVERATHWYLLHPSYCSAFSRKSVPGKVMSMRVVLIIYQIMERPCEWAEDIYFCVVLLYAWDFMYTINMCSCIWEIGMSWG
jgi:hypothetical protein